MAIADEVVAALKDNRLMFAYQPIIDAGRAQPVHYECLLRMRREDGTIVTAGHFIPAAEQLGLVRLVDRRALEMTIATLHAHPRCHAGRQRVGHDGRRSGLAAILRRLCARQRARWPSA